LKKKINKRGEYTLKHFRKFKRLENDIGLIIIKFLIIMSIIEGYFLLIYFLSIDFLNKVNLLTN